MFRLKTTIVLHFFGTLFQWVNIIHADALLRTVIDYEVVDNDFTSGRNILKHIKI